jgi:hypothetical protein
MSGKLVDGAVFCRQISDETNRHRIISILHETKDYCERVKSIALYYMCIEEIESKRYFYRATNPGRIREDGTFESMPGKKLKLRNSKKTTYKYDFQLVKKDEELVEQRILLEENRKVKNKKNAELKVKFNAKYLIYGPVGFTSAYWRYFFDYEILGMEKINGQKATVMSAVPKPNNTENKNIAKIWISEKDDSILRIEWEPQSIIDYEERNLESEAGDLRTTVVWRVDYGVEKNGVRFPSRQYIQEFLISETGDRYILNEITFNFTDYKFFIVETEIKH